MDSFADSELKGGRVMKRKGPGRPKVKPSQKYSKLVAVRMTVAEKQRLVRMAKYRGTGISEFIRSMIF